MPRVSTPPDAEALAIQAIGFIAADAERLGRFLAATGLGPKNLRQAASSPRFLCAVLDHLMADETLLLAFSAFAEIKPDAVAKARLRLESGDAPAR